MRNAGEASRDPYLLGSLHKGLEVIDCFTRKPSWTLAELVGALDQSKATLFRILYTLESFGYVHKEGVRYSLGLRFRTLGSAAVQREQLRWQSLPPLQELAQQTGETVHVGILYDGEAICVQAVDGTHLVRAQSLLGKAGPLHASALGKVLLAHLPESQRESLLSGRQLTRYTPNTITDTRKLHGALQVIRRQGWVLDNEELEPGLRCVGAPIMDHTRQVCAAVAISAPASRMDKPRIDQLIPRVKGTAQRISEMLGCPATPHADINAA